MLITFTPLPQTNSTSAMNIWSDPIKTWIYKLSPLTIFSEVKFSLIINYFGSLSINDYELINFIGLLIFSCKVSLDNGKTQGSMHRILCICSVGILFFCILIMVSRHVAPPKEWPTNWMLFIAILLSGNRLLRRSPRRAERYIFSIYCARTFSSLFLRRYNIELSNSGRLKRCSSKENRTKSLLCWMDTTM